MIRAAVVLKYILIFKRHMMSSTEKPVEKISFTKNIKSTDGQQAYFYQSSLCFEDEKFKENRAVWFVCYFMAVDEESLGREGGEELHDREARKLC